MKKLSNKILREQELPGNYNSDVKNYFPKNLNAAPQKPSNQLNFRSNFSSTCTENSNISLLMIKNLSI
jgi:hypothetical protein